MSKIPTHIQRARNLHANETGICNICGETVAKPFWETHIKERHAGVE